MMKLLVVLMMFIFLQSHAQDGLTLSQLAVSPKQNIVHNHHFELAGWWQPQTKNSSGGLSYAYSPYFKLSKSQIKVKLGVYGAGKISNAQEVPLMVIFPQSPAVELTTGYTKLFPQNSGETYYEMAFNADFTYGYRTLHIADINKRSTISTYNMRSGFELIPIPRVLSFYGNVDILFGVSGSGQYQIDTGTAPLLKAEYFDAGVKTRLAFCSCKHGVWSFTGDFNMLFTEKRIRELTGNGDTVIPNLKIGIAFDYLK